tara:strand:+ start:2991 stop:3707 length:717 start_codon:yes stop_codon:yes gene_type:complete
MNRENIVTLILILSIPLVFFQIFKGKISNGRINKLVPLTLLFFYFTLFLFIPLIWCYNPSLLLNTKYEVVSKDEIKDIEETSLFISDHHIQFLDQTIMLTEILKNNRKFNVVSKKADFITNVLKSLPLLSKYDLIKVDKNKNTNVVNKCIDKIKKENQNVLFFMTETSFKKNGIYHILEKTKVPIVLVRFKEIPTGNYVFNRKFEVEYEKIKDYKLIEDKQIFMNSIKNKLYPNKNQK